MDAGTHSFAAIWHRPAPGRNSLLAWQFGDNHSLLRVTRYAITICWSPTLLVDAPRVRTHTQRSMTGRHAITAINGEVARTFSLRSRHQNLPARTASPTRMRLSMG